jgi:UDP-N-acetylmuramoyl-tripeptide--D-alanyl-D-alanine ligase
MKALTLSEVSRMSSGRLSNDGVGSVAVRRVSTDSRDIRDGDLFVALKGEHFNGHDFLTDVAAKGGTAVMVELKEMKTKKTSLPSVLVEDALMGLQTLAKNYRTSLKVQTVAVAGSNGKTGTKEMAASVLSTRFSVSKNYGNLNNHIGVPVSLMGLDSSHQMGVFEIGTNHPGELQPLLQMVQPLAGIITVIGEEHLEFFGDLDGVAQEEGTLAEVLPKEGLLVLNSDDERSLAIARRSKAKVTYFGFSNSAAYRAEDVSVSASGTSFTLITPKGKEKVSLKLIGRHQVANALAAAAIGEFFGLEIQEIRKGLEAVVPYKMRMESRTMRNGAVVINDAYNANPSSMRAALETVGELKLPGKRFAVLGEMRELGGVSKKAHQEIGAHVVQCGFDVLVVFGKSAEPLLEGIMDAEKKSLQIEIFSEHQQVAEFLKTNTQAGDVVLLKASRGVELERVLGGWE